jgi:hypothetical protein
MGWPSPSPMTAVAGQLMTAAIWNVQVRDALNFLKALVDLDGAIGRERLFGGDAAREVGDTTYVQVPGSRVIEVSDTAQAAATTIEVHAMAQVAAGTGSLRLWNVTLGVQVGSAVTFTGTSPTLVKITGLLGTLASGINQYRVEVKGAAATDRPSVWGAGLVVR